MQRQPSFPGALLAGATDLRDDYLTDPTRDLAEVRSKLEQECRSLIQTKEPIPQRPRLRSPIFELAAALRHTRQGHTRSGSDQEPVVVFARSNRASVQSSKGHERTKSPARSRSSLRRQRCGRPRENLCVSQDHLRREEQGYVSDQRPEGSNHGPCIYDI